MVVLRFVPVAETQNILKFHYPENKRFLKVGSLP